MKTTTGEHGFFRRLNFYSARSLIIAGILFCASNALAQLSPGDTNGPIYTPLDTWSFYDYTNWTSDLHFRPISFTNLAHSYLGDGQSVVVDANIPAWLNYNTVETNGATNLTVNTGTVMFWFGPDWASTNAGGSGPGVWAQLFNVGELNSTRQPKHQQCQRISDTGMASRLLNPEKAQSTSD